MKRFFSLTSSRRAGHGRQGVLPFWERSERRQRAFKRIILAATAALIVAMVGLAPAGRYRVRDWTGRAWDEVQQRVLGLPVDRERIEAEWRDRRRHESDRTYETLVRFYGETSEEVRALFRAMGIDPEHALIRHGRDDQTFVFSPHVFEPDDRGRSYRLRPATRSVWLRHLTLRNGPYALFQVPDTPEVRAAAAATGAIIEDRSIQHTNSWGLSGPEPDLSAPVRGLVLGDSFMQGVFNGDDDTPPSRLQRYLQSAWKTPVTVVNTGHVGYSPEQYYYSLLEYGDRVKPTFVVLSVCTNDFGDDFAVIRGEGDGFDEAGFWLGEIRQWCRSRNATCLLVPVPVHLYLETMRRADCYPGAIDRIYRTIAGYVCDPLNDFADEHLRLRRIAEQEKRLVPQSPLYNLDISDNHLSPRGAALWADVVGRRLTRLLDPTHPDPAPSAAGTAPSPGPPRDGRAGDVAGTR